MTFGNGTVQTFTLNDRLQMANQTLSKGAEVLQKYDYGYGQIDASGNLDTTKNNGQLGKIESYIGAAKQWTQKFSYDHIGRLKQSEERRGDTDALTYKQIFDFDRFGNLYRKTASNPTSGQENPLLYTPIEDSDISKATNRFTSNTTYDDAGNVVTDDKFRALGFGYDANGRMVKATKPSTPDALSVYDASGLRVAEKVNDVWRFLIYDIGGKLVAEYGGPQSTDEGGVKYLLSDWQGSTRATVGNTGYVLGRMDFTAFGEEIGSGTGLRTAAQGFGNSTSPRQKYGLTERDDATGLDHTWFRKHENRAGRWTSPDPYNGSMSLGDPQSFNRYSYVSNEPTNFIDPTGLLEEGEACDYRGTEPDGAPIYLGTIRNGRCVPNWGPPVQVHYDEQWVASHNGPDPFNTPDLIAVDESSFGVLDGLQLGLDVCGLVPGFGEVADGANALISLGRGDYTGAALSASAMVPFFGWGGTAAKFGRNGARLLGAAQPTTLENGITLSGHAVERFVGRESHVTGSMIQTTLRRGEKYWDPKNQSYNYFLRNGFVSGHSLLIGQNPNTGLITTIMSGRAKKVLRPRMQKCN